MREPIPFRNETLALLIAGAVSLPLALSGCSDDDNDEGQEQPEERAQALGDFDTALAAREDHEASNPDDYDNVDNVRGTTEEQEALYDAAAAAPGNFLGFVEVPAPDNDIDKRRLIASGVAATKRSPAALHPTGFNVILRSGDVPPGAADSASSTTSTATPCSSRTAPPASPTITTSPPCSPWVTTCTWSPTSRAARPPST
jgi:hypothetical protein